MAPNPPVSNRLIDRLPRKDRARLIAKCETVDLTFAEVIAQPGDGIPHVYFPTGGFISLLTRMGGKDILEVALVGNEGVYGVPVALGVTVSPVLALVQGSGPSLRLGAAAFRRELARLPELRAIVDRYIVVSMSEFIRTAGCNRFHVVEQRVARWLLLTADRAHASSFRITHEFLAYMLGVRRVGVTEAASALQERNLIRYTRGVVTISDRRGLERASCRCYRNDVADYATILDR